MTDEPQAVINHIHREPRLGGMIALTLSIRYTQDTEAEATILLRPGQLIPPTADSIRHEILRLGQALQEAAQSPQGISAFLPKQD